MLVGENEFYSSHAMSALPSKLSMDAAVLAQCRRVMSRVMSRKAETFYSELTDNGKRETNYLGILYPKVKPS